MKKFNYLTLVFVAGSLASASSLAKTRYLKYRADIGYIKGKVFDVPGRGKVDFAEVINLQAPGVISEHGVFQLMNVAPHGGSIMTASGFQTFFDRDVTAPAPYCVKNYPQVVMSGNVVGYEMTSGIGIKFGYSPDGDLGPITDVGVNVKIDRAQLDMQLETFHPLNREFVASAIVGSGDTRTTIGTNIDFSKVTLGPEFFFQSKLINVTGNAIKKSLERISPKFLDDFPSGTDSRDPAQKFWFTQVFKVEQSPSGRRFAYIYGDTQNLCIEQGDQFEVYVPKYFWPDESRPCFGVPSGPTLRSAGTLTIMSPPTGGLSYGEITDSNSESAIPAGAIVKVKKLVNNPKSACQK